MISPITKQYVTDLLASQAGHQINMTYTKVNGETRDVNLKLNRPALVRPGRGTAASAALVRGYDVDRQGLRTFRTDMISEIVLGDTTYLIV